MASAQPVHLSLTYSNQPSTSENNRGTLNTTALSVANYRTQPPPPPPCNLSPPQNIQSDLLGVCFPEPWTKYYIDWEDSCPSQTTYYEVWSAQPTNNPFVYDWTTFINSSYVWVTGADALIKAKACNSFSCSSLGLGAVYAGSFCDDDDYPPGWP